jgi:hypothetical protein
MDIEDYEGVEKDATKEAYTKVLNEVLNDTGLEIAFSVAEINSVEFVQHLEDADFDDDDENEEEEDS